jgi:type II secretory pathway predicted ATPase ExeA
MYEAFYSLQERPFDMVPNPRFLFMGARQREALSNLQYGLTTPRGLTLLIGEAGTGKTTLVHAALSELRGTDVRVVLLSNPTLTRSEFYEYLAEAFGLSPDAASSKTRFLLEIRKKLEQRHASGVLSALIIDEAQSVPYELLEEVRLLSNMETPTTKLLNVVLTGQPELADRLNESSLRQLKQRISLRCELTAMNLSETAAYIAGRLRIAGGRPEQVFTREAVGALYEASRGLPRTVNVIADNALLAGFALNTRPVTSAVVHEVCRDLDISHRPPVKLDMPAAAKPPAEPPPPLAPGPGGRWESVAGLPAIGADPTAAELPPDDDASELFGMFGRKRKFSIF